MADLEADLDADLKSFLDGNVDPRAYDKALEACKTKGIWTMKILKNLFNQGHGDSVFVIGTALVIADALKRKWSIAANNEIVPKLLVGSADASAVLNSAAELQPQDGVY